MTIKEALTTKAQNLNLTVQQIDLALIEADLQGGTEFTSEHGKAVDLAYVTLLLEGIRIAEVKEDDVSIKYATDLKSIVSAIHKKWGLTDPFLIPKATVKQKQIW